MENQIDVKKKSKDRAHNKAHTYLKVPVLRWKATIVFYVF